MDLTVRDDLGRQLVLPAEPRRVLSLVPSETYNLARLGLADRLVGRSDYCVEPAAELEGVPTVGGTKNPDVDRILSLQPDLVLANQEENRRADVERIEAAGIATLVSFPRTVRQGIEAAARLASLWPSVSARSEVVLSRARSQVERLAARQPSPVRCFVPIWLDPLMTANGDTFTSDVIELVGGGNVFSDRQRLFPLAADLGRAPALPPEQTAGRDLRYPRVTLEEVAARRPELLLLPDEPYPFGPADAARLAAALGSQDPPRLSLWDGRDLTWYGLRCLAGLAGLAQLLDEVRACRDRS